MKVYLSGKITGIPMTEVTAAFTNAEVELGHQGHITLTPLCLPQGLDYEDYMDVCYAMIDVSDAICMLPNYLTSKGAKRELLYAQSKCKRVLYLKPTTQEGELSFYEGIY